MRIELEQKEIGIRQTGIVVPAVTKIDHFLFGNGKIGLADEHIICQDRLKRYDKITDKLVGIIITIIVQFLFTGAGLAFVYFKR
jgi:hypothetical protein